MPVNSSLKDQFCEFHAEVSFGEYCYHLKYWTVLHLLLVMHTKMILCSPKFSKQNILLL